MNEAYLVSREMIRAHQVEIARGVQVNRLAHKVATHRTDLAGRLRSLFRWEAAPPRCTPACN